MRSHRRRRSEERSSSFEGFSNDYHTFRSGLSHPPQLEKEIEEKDPERVLFQLLIKEDDKLTGLEKVGPHSGSGQVVTHSR